MTIIQRAMRKVDPKTGKATGKWFWTRDSDEEQWCHVAACCENCGGHETAEEAQKCYASYRLHSARYSIIDKDTARRCLKCGEFTRCKAIIPGIFSSEYPLCEKHCNVATLKEFVR